MLRERVTERRSAKPCLDLRRIGKHSVNPRKLCLAHARNEDLRNGELIPNIISVSIDIILVLIGGEDRNEMARLWFRGAWKDNNGFCVLYDLEIQELVR